MQTHQTTAGLEKNYSQPGVNDGGKQSVKVWGFFLKKKRKEKKERSYLAVLQVGVDVFDQRVVGVTSREGQLTQRTATDGALL